MTICKHKTFNLDKYIKLGEQNDSDQVVILKKFLRDYEGETGLVMDGDYEKQTYDAVVRFQEKYYEDVLVPWGHTSGTGYVYQTTIKKINELMCGKPKLVIQEVSNKYLMYYKHYQNL